MICGWLNLWMQRNLPFGGQTLSSIWINPDVFRGQTIYLFDVAEILEFMSLFISLNLGSSWTLFNHLYPVKSAQ